ncbi:hypothetical protein ACMFMG_011369 [Clarireedia jacksonii]
MSSLDVTPTPAEIAYQVSHWNDDYGPVAVATASVFFVLATIFVILRLLARRVQHVKWQLDDYFIILALVLTAGCFAIAILLKHKFGMHAVRVGLPNLVIELKLYFILELVYNANHFAIKVSILLLYRTIFTLHDSWFSREWKFVFGYVILCGLVGILTVILQCIPPSYSWEVLNGGKGKCTNLIGTEIGNGATLTFADFMILILPMKSLWQLHLPLSRKLQVSPISLLFCMTNEYKDTGVYPLIWSLIEVDLGIICACGPTLRSLFIRRTAPSTRAHDTFTSSNKETTRNDKLRSIISKFRGISKFGSKDTSQDSSWSMSWARHLELLGDYDHESLVRRPTELREGTDTMELRVMEREGRSTEIQY